MDGVLDLNTVSRKLLRVPIGIRVRSVDNIGDQICHAGPIPVTGCLIDDNFISCHQNSSKIRIVSQECRSLSAMGRSSVKLTIKLAANYGRRQKRLLQTLRADPQ